MRAGRLLVKSLEREYLQHRNTHIYRTNETTCRIREYFYKVLFIDKRKLLCDDKAHVSEGFGRVIMLEQCGHPIYVQVRAGHAE
jgi:hypothetical protein